MKKICVLFAVFAALIFVVSCGGGSSKTGGEGGNSEKHAGELGGECYGNGTCNAGLLCDEESNICVEDPENPTDGSDTSSEQTNDDVDTASGENDNDSNSENPDSAPDSGDSQPDSDSSDTMNSDDSDPDGNPSVQQTACNPNPCEHVENSTGECLVNSSYSYVCTCRNGYYFDGAGCSKNSSELKECSPTSATPCFDSATGLVWSGKAPERIRWIDAVDYCKNLNEGGFSDWRLPSIAVLTTLVQNCYNSNGCTGDTDGKYSKFGDIVFLWSSSGGSSEAQGVYFYNAASQSKSVDESFDARCVRREGSETRPANCLVPQHSEWNTVSEITQTWDWDQMWIPSSNGKYNEESSTTECRFKCEENYFWDSSKQRCLNPCDNCATLTAFTDKTCTAYSLEKYYCGGTDPSSGLTWSTRSSGSMNWRDSKSYCNNLTENGYSDWHLPTISELKTLVKNCSAIAAGGSCYVSDSCSSRDCFNYDDCINNSCSEDSHGGYSKFGEAITLRSSSENDNKEYVWGVNFQLAWLEGASKEENYVVRCVRGKMKHPCDANPCAANPNSVCTAISTEQFSCYGTDPATNLTWSARALSKMTWQDAVDYCNSYSEDGLSGWHLPTIDELKTLLTSATGGTPRSANCAVSETNGCLAWDGCWTCSTCTEQGTTSSNTCSNWGTSYDDGRFSKLGDTGWVWSSSTSAGNTYSAWLVAFDYGYVYNSNKANHNYVRCVR
ncbi:DUF1566 domain-containing protein [bacterium]|nr:DUF1566 domain-containing protein [bacterium]